MGHQTVVCLQRRREGRVQHGRCAVIHNSCLKRQCKASLIANAQTQAGARVCPLLNHGDLKDFLHYSSFPKKYLHFQRRGLSQTGSSVFFQDALSFSCKGSLRVVLNTLWRMLSSPKPGTEVQTAYAQNLNLLHPKLVELWLPAFHEYIKHIIIYCLPGLFFLCFQSWDCQVDVSFAYTRLPEEVPSGERHLCKDFLSYTSSEPALKKAGKAKSCSAGILIFLVN